MLKNEIDPFIIEKLENIPYLNSNCIFNKMELLLTTSHKFTNITILQYLSRGIGSRGRMPDHLKIKQAPNVEQ